MASANRLGRRVMHHLSQLREQGRISSLASYRAMHHRIMGNKGSSLSSSSSSSWLPRLLRGGPQQFRSVIWGQQLYYFQQIQQVNPRQVQPGHPVSQGIPIPTNKPLFLLPQFRPVVMPLIHGIRMPYIQTNKQLIAGVQSSISYSTASNDTFRSPESWNSSDWGLFLAFIAAMVGLFIIYYLYMLTYHPTWMQRAQKYYSENIHKYPLKRTDISNLPKSFDWRDYDVLPPVRNQGRCGSCYAIAVCEAVECLFAIHTGVRLNLSPQELVDCDKENRGCVGGTVLNSFKYIKENGIGMEPDYAYTAEQKRCKVDKTKPRFFITDFKQLPYVGYDEELLMQAVYHHPVVVLVDVGSFRFDGYRGGVYKAEPYFFNQQLHTMLLVGYGQHKNEDVWILQNSYGTGFGDKGFIYMKRNTGTTLGCSGIRVAPLYPIIDELCMEAVRRFYDDYVKGPNNLESAGKQCCNDSGSKESVKVKKISNLTE